MQKTHVIFNFLHSKNETNKQSIYQRTYAWAYDRDSRGERIAGLGAATDAAFFKTGLPQGNGTAHVRVTAEPRRCLRGM